MNLNQLIEKITMYSRKEQEVSGTLRELLKAHNITGETFRVLHAIGMTKKCSAKDIADRTAILGPSVSRILSKLTDCSMIRATPAQDDHRRLEISITARGRNVINAVHKEYEQ